MATSPTHSSKAQTSTHRATDWWQTGSVYQIYIRSFFDTNNDGVGDLPGVIEKLDYIADLGVNSIWLSPVTASANTDWGYDVTDYYTIDPALGTLADFDRLLTEATKRNIKVLLDLVPNHTSIQHPWFKDALTGRHAKYRDFYMWANPKKDGRPPNNWVAAEAGTSAWEYHAPSGQYYLHNFFKEQADLNWRNPAVIEEFDKIMRFWLDRGVAGFRIDVFNTLIKDEQLRDNPKSVRTDELEIRRYHQRPVYNTAQPEVHEILKRWRKTVDSYPEKALLLGETNRTYDMNKLASYYGDQDEMKLIINLAFLDSTLNAAPLREIVEHIETALTYDNWPLWAGSNHDKPRFPTRWAEGNEAKIRCALMLMFCLRGTPVLYYGDELGMQDVFVAPWRIKDPRGRKYWPIYGGRDRSRTPMPWENKRGAGFTGSEVRPWLPYGDNSIRNVASETEQTDSTLHFTRALIALRTSERDLHAGDYATLPGTEQVWAWQRGADTVVVINFSDHNQELRDMQGDILLGTVRQREGTGIDGLLSLGPWEGVILRRSKPKQ